MSSFTFLVTRGREGAWFMLSFWEKNKRTRAFTVQLPHPQAPLSSSLIPDCRAPSGGPASHCRLTMGALEVSAWALSLCPVPAQCQAQTRCSVNSEPSLHVTLSASSKLAQPAFLLPFQHTPSLCPSRATLLEASRRCREQGPAVETKHSAIRPPSLADRQHHTGLTAHGTLYCDAQWEHL